MAPNRTRALWIGLSVFTVVAVAVLASVLANRSLVPADATEALLVAVRRERILPDDAKVVVTSQLASIASRDPEVRAWLQRFVRDSQRPPNARLKAFGVLWDMPDGAALREALEEIAMWLRNGPQSGAQSDFVRQSIRSCVVHRTLLTDWPVPQVMELIRKASPDGWEAIVRTHAAWEAGRPTPWPEDQQVKMTASAKALLEYAESQQARNATTEGAHEQPQPQAHPAPPTK